jgi:hypothetical protein
MTDANEPTPATPPPIPPTAPPPPVGQPIGQPSIGQPQVPQAYQPAPPAAPRSQGKFVAGLILTILGGIWALVGLRNIAIAAVTFADDPGYAVGRVVGGLLIPIALLIVGIVLIRSSKNKAS